ncbi:binder of sperm protein homolog 1 [Tupaia chinensis]|uniref:binder of sperm protein homolog 1 n=1 Tax=Tupaia chinensis TaxID=246437 RepID=UPI0003C8F027|nr:binder of sperm protein homolog 1 [Tupaia chinensis]
MGRLAGHLLIWACLLHSVTAGFDNGGFQHNDIDYLPEVEDGQCIFPFRFKDELYYDCIKFKTKHKWCSLNKTFIGYWKFCNWEDFAKCMFPFWYRRMIYRECTDVGSESGKKWCSLTKNFNKDRIWKYC